MTTIREEHFTVMGKKNSSVGEQLLKLVPSVFVTLVLWQSWSLVSDQWNIHDHDSTAVKSANLNAFVNWSKQLNVMTADVGDTLVSYISFLAQAVSPYYFLQQTLLEWFLAMVVPDKCMWQNTKTDSSNVNCKNETNLTGIPAVKFQIEALRYCNFRIDRFEQWYFQSFQKKLPRMVFEGSTSIHSE